MITIATSNAAAPAAPAAAPMHEIAKCLVPGDIVFDLGAHFGDKAAALLGRGATVVCVEPQPACVAVLKSRYGNNPQVSVVPKGVGSRVGILEMQINSRSPVLSTFSPEWQTGRFKGEVWDQKIDVQITTLDNLVREYGVPRYVKIDVEGFEYEVISGLTQRVGVISFEFTDEFIGNAERLLRYLENLGYTRFNFSLGERDDFALAAWVPLAQLLPTLREVCTRYPNVWGDIYAN